MSTLLGIDVNDYGLQQMKSEGGGSQPVLTTLNVTPSTSSQSISPEQGVDGFSQVNVSAVTSSIDANILPTNIRAGKTILGVQGNLEPDKPDQNKTVTPTTSTQEIIADIGYELGKVTVNGVTSSIDNNIVAGNIKKNVTILGVTGTYEGMQPSGIINITQNGYHDVSNYAGANVIVPTLDTSDATATASDIAQGKTAYANGVKLTGTASGGGSGLDWSAIGFDTQQSVEQPILESIYDMASNIYNGWDEDYSSIVEAIDTATNNNRSGLIIFPGVTMSENNSNKNCEYAFDSCTNLVEIGELNFTIDSSTSYMFGGCTNLRYVPVLDTTEVTDMEGMFTDCMQLTNACLDNIAQMCIQATNVGNKSVASVLGIQSNPWVDNRFNYLNTNYYMDLTNAGWSFD